MNAWKNDDTYWIEEEVARQRRQPPGRKGLAIVASIATAFGIDPEIARDNVSGDTDEIGYETIDPERPGFVPVEEFSYLDLHDDEDETPCLWTPEATRTIDTKVAPKFLSFEDAEEFFFGHLEEGVNNGQSNVRVNGVLISFGDIPEDEMKITWFLENRMSQIVETCGPKEDDPHWDESDWLLDEYLDEEDEEEGESADPYGGESKYRPSDLRGWDATDNTNSYHEELEEMEIEKLDTLLLRQRDLKYINGGHWGRGASHDYDRGSYRGPKWARHRGRRNGAAARRMRRAGKDSVHYKWVGFPREHNIQGIYPWMSVEEICGFFLRQYLDLPPEELEQYSYCT